MKADPLLADRELAGLAQTVQVQPQAAAAAVAAAAAAAAAHCQANPVGDGLQVIPTQLQVRLASAGRVASWESRWLLPAAGGSVEQSRRAAIDR